MRILLLVPKIRVTALVIISSPTTRILQFRWGLAQDPWAITHSQIRNLQVPAILLLRLKQRQHHLNNQLVMETIDTNNNHNPSNKAVIIGWAHIRPMGYAQRDPSRFV